MINEGIFEMALFCIGAQAIRKALADIETAEKNGFNHCLAVLEVVGAADRHGNLLLGYSDLWERAHPSDGWLDWGRCQSVTTRNRFDGEKLVPITEETE